MAYALAYCVHTLEMNALRGWGVAFLAFVARAPAHAGRAAVADHDLDRARPCSARWPASLGNEAAIRFGRRRLIVVAMVLSIVVRRACSASSAPWSYWLAVVLLLLYGLIVWLDSSSLTAGAAGTAEPSRRGATLAVHSMLGYVGGFVGPLAVGWTLDCAGGMSPVAWGPRSCWSPF